MNARLRADRLATGTLWAVAIFVVAVLLAIILNFVIKSIGVVSPSFLTSAPRDRGLGGIGPLVYLAL
jgi:ABC-type phosphate transport system permease subunit